MVSVVVDSGLEELRALVSDLRHQAKQDADLIIAQQLALKEKDEVISMLRKSRLAVARSAPMTDKQHSVSDGESESEVEAESDAESTSPERDSPQTSESIADSVSAGQDSPQISESRTGSPQPSDSVNETTSTQAVGEADDCVSGGASEAPAESTSYTDTTTKHGTEDESPGGSSGYTVQSSVGTADPTVVVTDARSTVSPSVEKEVSYNNDTPSVSPRVDGSDVSLVCGATADTQSEPMDVDAEPDKKVFEVEEIWGSLISGKGSELWYLVKWKEYPLEECSWEPFLNLHGAEWAIEAFHEINGRPTAEKPKILDIDGRDYESYRAKAERAEAERMFGAKKAKTVAAPRKRRTTPVRSLPPRRAQKVQKL